MNGTEPPLTSEGRLFLRIEAVHLDYGSSGQGDRKEQGRPGVCKYVLGYEGVKMKKYLAALIALPLACSHAMACSSRPGTPNPVHVDSYNGRLRLLWINRASEPIITFDIDRKWVARG